MSTHAIAWFDEEDVLNLDAQAEVPAQASCERRWPRIKVDVRIRVTYSERGELTIIDGQGNDVSQGGMTTYIPADLNTGDNVIVEVVQRYGRPRISFSARISNRNGFRYGLEYVGVEDEHREGLMNSITGCSVSQ